MVLVADSLFQKPQDEKLLSWEDTFRAMAEEDESWEDFDEVAGDGLE